MANDMTTAESKASDTAFKWNPSHPIGTCAKCGGEMVHNVPRLGPDGGFVHKATGTILCKKPTPQTPSSINYGMATPGSPAGATAQPFNPIDPSGRLHERLEFWVEIPDRGVCRVTYKLEAVRSELT